jgi:sugar lactone lactonase YvrE
MQRAPLRSCVALAGALAPALLACGDNLPTTDDPVDVDAPTGGPDGEAMIDATPGPDADVGPCVVEAPSVIAPVWIAGFSGAAGVDGGFGRADAIMLDPNGILLVGLEDYGEIAMFDTEAVAGGVAPPLDDIGGWNSISGITHKPSTGEVFVVEQATDEVRVMAWTADPRMPPYLEEVTRFGAPAVNPDDPQLGEFVRAQTLEFDSLGRAYVADDGRDALGARWLQQFDDDLTPLGVIGQGDLAEPENFVIDEGRDRIYVTDETNADIAVFEFGSHDLETRFGTFEGIPNGVDLDQDGNLYVMDEDAGQVIVYDPTTLTEVYRFGDSSGELDATLGKFNSPDTLKIDVARNVLMVTDQGHRRIQAFALDDIRARACLDE